MTDLTRKTRRARSRAVRSKRSRPAGLVVALMMALVFIPVLALHAVALSGAVTGPARPGEVARTAQPQATPADRKQPG